MSDLMITLPTIDETWIESNFFELLSDGTDFFETVQPSSLEFSVGALGYADAYDNMSYQDRERFYLSEEESEVTRRCRKYVESYLKDWGLWGKSIITKQEIDNYNECIREIIFMIADQYALGFAKFLGLRTYEDEL